MTTTKDRQQVTVSSMPGNWTTLSGGDSEREISKQRPGAGAQPVTYAGRMQHNDVTTTRTYEDPAAMAVLVRRLQKTPESFDGTTITTQDLDPDDVPIPGAKVVRTGCAVKSVTPTEADANSGEPAMLTVVWSVGGIA